MIDSRLPAGAVLDSLHTHIDDPAAFLAAAEDRDADIGWRYSGSDQAGFSYVDGDVLVYVAGPVLRASRAEREPRAEDLLRAKVQGVSGSAAS